MTRLRPTGATAAERDSLTCADCGATIAWHSDEAREWAPIEDVRGYVTVCVDCYRTRYGNDEADEHAKQTRDDQRDERDE